MGIYKKVFDYFEGQYDQINEQIYSEVIKQFMKETNFQYDNISIGDNEQNFNLLYSLLCNGKKDIEIMNNLLTKYHYNFFKTILLLISGIANSKSENHEKVYMERLLNSKLVDEIYVENNVYSVSSIVGKFQFKKAKDFFEKNNSRDIYEKLTEEYQEYCHYTAYQTMNCIQNSYGYTALCLASFVGTYYHSFTKIDDWVIDINYGVMIPYEQYVKLQGLKIINVCNSVNDDDPNKLLFLAVNEQIKKGNVK